MEKQLSLSFDNTAIAFEAKTDHALKKANFLFSNIGKPWLVKFGSVMTPIAFKLRLPIKGIIKNTIFSQFCGGESLEEAATTALQLGNYHVGVVLDYGVEAMEGEDSYDAAVPEFIRAIQYAASRPDIPFIAIKVTGFARFELLEKVHRKEALTSAEQEEYTRVRGRVRAIAEAGAKHNVAILIDAEESWIQGPVDELTDEMMALFNKDKVIIYNTFQMYCHDRYAFLQVSLAKAQEKGYLLGAKLVRGAYMEKENKRAAENNYPTPIQPSKAATDKDYDAAVKFCIDNIDKLAVFIGTHNENSCMLAARMLDQKGIPHNHSHVSFSQLLGMSDNITFNLAHAGYNVTKYLPYGPVKDVMPYLLRRAQENTSIAGQMGRELGLIRKEMKRRGLN
ncbi:proline dehydrogenase [Chitinophaga polysaccharea]|uniref:proline dehydrogenase family protein n=1 Tax=Chitinophaga TaxID=79328 RepID=UPI001455669A|nr:MULTISPECIES: proline dehydrogenase family protein [Chitinophaga]NLR57232.1 proline dehydrogenase [Chitinophaga polysaccharea]NLU91650.1 proline dehydrogenase [Chitinophaga sp. Ak27]